ncbi:Clp protease ClpP [Halomonas cupida]|uniref:head maturation protease, ClpP-related n=1 Tax=Halomonas cupida TaxID=44933 RepID=UPI0039B45D35
MTWFTAVAAASDSRRAQVVIDKPIGSDWAPDWISDFTGEQPARDFIDAVEALGEIDVIDLEINSPGGDVASGIRIFNYLRNHKAIVNVRVTGTAASIATVIMMAGDTRTMGVGATIMTHRAASLMIGFYTAAEMKEFAKNIDVIDAAIVEAYAAATGKSAEAINSLLDQGDTFMGADEAIDWGFATDKDAKLKAVACADPRMFQSQIQQQGKIRQLEAQLAAKGEGGSNEPMTAADALALAFDLTPQEAEAQAADLGDRIIALQQAQPGSVEGFEITASSLRDSHPGVVAEIEAAAVAAIGPTLGADEVIAGERTRVVAIVNACQTTGQSQLLDKLVTSGMAEEQAIEYIYDVAAASGNKQTINGNHSPEGGQRATSIDHQKIYARLNRNPKAQ